MTGGGVWRKGGSILCSNDDAAMAPPSLYKVAKPAAITAADADAK